MLETTEEFCSVLLKALNFVYLITLPFQKQANILWKIQRHKYMLLLGQMVRRKPHLQKPFWLSYWIAMNM